MGINRFPVEAGHVLTFARAIGDTSASYSEDAFSRTGLAGVAVPPTFVQASAQFDPDYVLRPQPGKPWMTDQSESEPGIGSDKPHGTVLHAEQRYKFHRPLRVGDILSATQRIGRSWEKQRRSGGRLSFTETITEYRDGDAELVVVATAVAVRVPPASAGGEQ